MVDFSWADGKEGLGELKASTQRLSVAPWHIPGCYVRTLGSTWISKVPRRMALDPKSKVHALLFWVLWRSR